jgi:hypothetical protein
MTNTTARAIDTVGNNAAVAAAATATGRTIADTATTTVASVVANVLDVDIDEVIGQLLAFGRRVGEHVNIRELDGIVDDQRALARLQREDPNDTDPPPRIASTCGALNTIYNANGGIGVRTTDEWRFAALREIESRGRMAQAFAEALGTNSTVGRAFAAAEANAKTLVWRLIGCDLIKFRSPADARDAINAAAAMRASLIRASVLPTASPFAFDYCHSRMMSRGHCGVGGGCGDDDDDDDDDCGDDDGDDDGGGGGGGDEPASPPPPLFFIDSDSGFANDEEEMEK